MKHEQQRPDAQEQQLLAHFREHSNGEPPAELDALILNAARAELARPARLSPAQRLHNWLFGAGRQRWSLALAGIACVGIGVSLTWRTLERTPDTFDAVPGEVLMAPAMRSAAPAAPAAPMADAMPVPQARERQALAESTAKQSLATEVAPTEELAVGAASPAAPAAELSRQVAETEFVRQLRRLDKLRREGWQDEADQLLLQLMREYPQHNIEAELNALQRGEP